MVWFHLLSDFLCKMLKCTCKYVFLFLFYKMPTQLWLRVQKKRCVDVKVAWFCWFCCDWSEFGTNFFETKKMMGWIPRLLGSCEGCGRWWRRQRIYRAILDRVFNPKDDLSIALRDLSFRVEIKAGSEIRFTTVTKRENDSLCISEWFCNDNFVLFGFCRSLILLLNFAFLELTFHKVFSSRLIQSNIFSRKRGIYIQREKRSECSKVSNVSHILPKSVHKKSLPLWDLSIMKNHAKCFTNSTKICA